MTDFLKKISFLTLVLSVIISFFACQNESSTSNDSMTFFNDFENVTNQAYRVRAQVDVFMPGSARVGKLKGKSDGSVIASLNAQNGITRGELQRSAMNVLRVCLKML